jgi:hypothetical protein
MNTCDSAQRPSETGTPAVATAASVVTISYRGDLELARDLCASVDAFLDERIEHVLVVPRADVDLFASLRSQRRRIVVVEDVLPADYHRIPLPQQIRLGRFRRRLRETWWTPRGVVRGWIIQQIVKLSAPSYTAVPAVAFADSDVVLVAPLALERLVDYHGTRFYAVPGATGDSAMHARWHRTAQRLLGIAETGYSGADYIGNLITWQTDDIIALQEWIARVTRKRWDKAIVARRAFSEYILYGVFLDHVLGGASDRSTSEDLVHAGWFYDLTTEHGVDAFVAGVSGAPVGVAIQSTEHLTLSERRQIIDRISRRLRPERNPRDQRDHE